MKYLLLVLVPISKFQNALLPLKCCEPRKVPNSLFFYCFTLDSQLSALGSLGVFLDALLLPNYKTNSRFQKKTKGNRLSNFLILTTFWSTLSCTYPTSKLFKSHKVKFSKNQTPLQNNLTSNVILNKGLPMPCANCTMMWFAMILFF